ncbi:MAG: hypothetical protein SLAVMIC_00837 [uncultured marine phage]|uniref:Uncharacterized protein n=1 Tax=uncultured marine phage TaxID=707152 RepID=A0A8D9FRF1_9VIRU|nr:MAG: hypothetical protein SLAVMIC_00837 [uncultured marine phage]
MKLYKCKDTVILVNKEYDSYRLHGICICSKNIHSIGQIGTYNGGYYKPIKKLVLTVKNDDVEYYTSSKGNIIIKNNKYDVHSHIKRDGFSMLSKRQFETIFTHGSYRSSGKIINKMIMISE